MLQDLGGTSVGTFLCRDVNSQHDRKLSSECLGYSLRCRDARVFDCIEFNQNVTVL